MELWKELHVRALNFKGEDDSPYLISFRSRIPRFTTGCSCKEFWIVWIRQNPPTFDKYFEWTVKAHNAVNAKLGKPTYTVEEAREFYKNGVEAQGRAIPTQPVGQVKPLTTPLPKETPKYGKYIRVENGKIVYKPNKYYSKK